MHSLLFLVLIVTLSLVSLYFGLSSSSLSSSLLLYSSSSVVLNQQQSNDQPNFIQHDHEFVSLPDFLSFFDDDELVPPSSTVCVKVPSLSSSKNKNDVSARTTAISRRQYLKFFTHHLVAQLSFPFHWKYPDTSLYWGLTEQQREQEQENQQTPQDLYSMVKLSSQRRSSSLKRNSTSKLTRKKKAPPALSELVDPFVHPGARFPLYKKFGDKLQSVSCHHGVLASDSSFSFSSSRCCVQKKTSSDIVETRANRFRRLPDCRGGTRTSSGVCQIPEMFVV